MEDNEPGSPSTLHHTSLPLRVHGDVHGILTLKNNASGVARVGERLEGSIRITHIANHVETVAVGLSETLKVNRVAELIVNADEGFEGVVEAHGETVDKDYETSKHVFTTSVVHNVKDLSARPSAEAPLELPFAIDIPEKALPTLRRNRAAVKHDAKVDEEVEVRVEIACHLVVAVIKEGKDKPTPLAVASIGLISSKVPEHLADYHKGEDNLFVWKRDKASTGAMTLKCLTPNPTIGKPIEFELTFDKTKGPVEWIGLYERLVFTEKPSEKRLDPHSLHKTKAGLHAPIMGHLGMASLADNSKKEESDKAEDDKIKEKDQNGKEKEKEQEKEKVETEEVPEKAKKADEEEKETEAKHASRKTAWYIDHSSHANYKPTAEELDAGVCRFVLSVPPKLDYQATFSTHSIYNFWMVPVKLGHHAVNFGPLPLVWNAEVDPNTLTKPQHRCDIV